MNSPFSVILPARYASQRLPAKALADIGGKPLIVRAAENARHSNADRVIVATDDERISKVLANHGIEFVMTDADLPSGTDRIAQAVERLALSDTTIIVNVQGDEPAMPSAVINQLANILSGSKADIATASAPIIELEEYLNPNAVKVVTDHEGLALYFSRSPIPFYRDHDGEVPKGARRHLGIYAYRADFIKCYAQMEPSLYELQESLEQLRALQRGCRISVLALNEAPPAGIDTQADLEAYRALMTQ